MKEVDAVIEAVNNLVAIRGEMAPAGPNTRQEVLADVLADCQMGWAENIRCVGRAIDFLRDHAHRSNPDTKEITSHLNYIMMKVASAIGDLKAYDGIKNTIRNSD